MRNALKVALLVAFLSPVLASAAPLSLTETAPPPGTVRFFNRDIVTFRASYVGVLPVDRAAQAASRIRDALAKDGPGTVKMVATPESLNVTIDGIYVFRILEGDLDAENGQTFEEAKTLVGQHLTEAIEAARSAVRGPELFRELALTVAATVGFCVAVWLLIRGRAWFWWRLDAYLARRLRMWEPERVMVARVIRTFGNFVFLAIVIVIAEECLSFVFRLFPYTRPWSEHLTGYVAVIAGQVASAAVDAAPGLLMVVIIATLAHVASKIVVATAHGIAIGRYRLFGLDAHTVHLARRLAVVVVWLFALAMAHPYLPGAGSEAFKGLSVLVGLMLSLGVSSLVGQAAGGFIVTFGHMLRPGEFVRVGEVEGAVVDVGMFSTRFRTPLDEEVNVPNSLLLSSITKNFSRPATSHAPLLETSVTIGYNAPWRQVHAMLLEAAARTDLLEREPAPQVFQTALSDFYVQYSLRVRLRDRSRRPEALSTLNGNVQDVFNKYGVQIMSPHYVLDPAAAVLVPKERWFDPPAARLGDGPQGTVEPPPTG